MSNCRPVCAVIIAGTNREKWDYVRSLFYGQRTEVRDTDDAARIADELTAQTQFLYDEALWSTNYSAKPFEKFLEWRYNNGTYQYGNLGDWKKDDHVGHCWALCPYDTACNDTRVRHLLDLDELDSLPTRSAHGIYYMRTESRGSKWGLECTYDNCLYYLANGQRYFYV